MQCSWKSTYQQHVQNPRFHPQKHIEHSNSSKLKIPVLRWWRQQDQKFKAILSQFTTSQFLSQNKNLKIKENLKHEFIPSHQPISPQLFSAFIYSFVYFYYLRIPYIQRMCFNQVCSPFPPLRFLIYHFLPISYVCLVFIQSLVGTTSMCMGQDHSLLRAKSLKKTQV